MFPVQLDYCKFFRYIKPTKITLILYFLVWFSVFFLAQKTNNALIKAGNECCCVCTFPLHDFQENSATSPLLNFLPSRPASHRAWNVRLSLSCSPAPQPLKHFFQRILRWSPFKPQANCSIIIEMQVVWSRTTRTRAIVFVPALFLQLFIW